MHQSLLARCDLRDLGLAALRTVVGLAVAADGAHELFSSAVPAMFGFAPISVPAPGVAAPLLALLELFGGLAILVGAFTRLAAFALALEMLAVIGLASAGRGFVLPSGVDAALVLLAATIAVVLNGPGALALGAYLVRPRR
jgi:putative oxidoreductase